MYRPGASARAPPQATRSTAVFGVGVQTSAIGRCERQTSTSYATARVCRGQRRTPCGLTAFGRDGSLLSCQAAATPCRGPVGGAIGATVTVTTREGAATGAGSAAEAVRRRATLSAMLGTAAHAA